MSQDIHDVVKLILARMDSHPEEFGGSGDDFITDDVDRWWKPLVAIRDFGSEEEKALINAKLRVIRLQKAHETAMDELLNGDDRRRKAEEEREYERNLLKSVQQQAYTSSLQNQMTTSEYNNRIMGALNNPQSGSFGKPHPVGPATSWGTTTGATNTGFVATMKKALGL